MTFHEIAFPIRAIDRPVEIVYDSYDEYRASLTRFWCRYIGQYRRVQTRLFIEEILGNKGILDSTLIIDQ